MDKRRRRKLSDLLDEMTGQDGPDKEEIDIVSAISDGRTAPRKEEVIGRYKVPIKNIRRFFSTTNPEAASSSYGFWSLLARKMRVDEKDLIDEALKAYRDGTFEIGLIFTVKAERYKKSEMESIPSLKDGDPVMVVYPQFYLKAGSFDEEIDLPSFNLYEDPEKLAASKHETMRKLYSIGKGLKWVVGGFDELISFQRFSSHLEDLWAKIVEWHKKNRRT